MKNILMIEYRVITLVALLFNVGAAFSQEQTWFLQLNATETTFYSDQERGLNLPKTLFSGFRSAPGISIGAGKWLTPVVALRIKVNGFHGRTVVGSDGDNNSSRYIALFGSAMFNLNQLILGKKDKGFWKFCPYLGGGINRNFTYDEYGIGLRIGVDNIWQLASRWGIHLDLAYTVYEPDADGMESLELLPPNANRHKLENRDRTLSIELGVCYKFGR